MTTLNAIQERHTSIKQQTAEYIDTHLQPLVKQYLEDIGYLLGLLQSHPASEPPDDDRQVIIKDGSLRRLGYYRCGHWWVFGSVGLHQCDDGVETWQELPFKGSNDV